MHRTHHCNSPSAFYSPCINSNVLSSSFQFPATPSGAMRRARANVGQIALVLVVASCAANSPEPASIYGHIQDAATGAPIAGAVVKTDPSTHQRITLESGDYQEITDVASGSYTVLAIKAGYDTAKTTVLVREHERKNVSMTLTKTAARVEVETVSISPPTVSLEVNQTQNLAAIIRDVAGITLTGRTVTWSTSNGAVASLSPTSGPTTVLTAVAPGTVNILAECEGRSKSIVAIIVAAPPVANVAVSSNGSSSVAVGNTLQLSATLTDATGRVLTGRAVSWLSSDPAKLFVSANGLATGMAVTNGVTVTATSENKVGTIQLAVVAPTASTVTVTPPSPSITVGATAQLTAVVKDASGNTIQNPTLVWTQADANIATVNQAGLVAGVSAGTTLITATSGQAIGSASVTVANPLPVVTSLSPNTVARGGAAFVLTVTGSGFVSGSVVRWNGTPRTTSYVSATSVQASISAADVASQGTAQITVSNPTPGGGVSTSAATFTIATQVFNGLVLAPAAMTMKVGQTAILAGTANGASASFTWASSNGAVASVESFGNSTTVVTALNVGVATISAISNGQVATASITVVNGSESVHGISVIPPSLSFGSPSVGQSGSNVFVGNLTTVVDAEPGVDKSVTWRSSDPSRVSVTSSGVYTVSGEARMISVCAVSVAFPSMQGCTAISAANTNPSLVVQPDNVTLAVGGTVSVAAAISGAPASFTWTSSNGAVLVVESNGNSTNVVRAVGRGTATISATTQGIVGAVTITVR